MFPLHLHALYLLLLHITFHIVSPYPNCNYRIMLTYSRSWRARPYTYSFSYFSAVRASNEFCARGRSLQRNRGLRRYESASWTLRSRPFLHNSCFRFYFISRNFIARATYAEAKRETVRRVASRVDFFARDKIIFPSLFIETLFSLRNYACYGYVVNASVANFWQ